MTQQNDKRTRLVDAASELFYRKGVSTTTLANIADLANVPLGNVYYYFKSKDSIILAVIDKRRNMLKELFAELEATQGSAKDRLAAFINKGLTNSETVASYGDYLGSLCQELGKQTGNISDATASIMEDILSWTEAQFSALDKAEPRKRAIALVSSMQGINLLTLTFKDPEFVNRQNSYLVETLEA